MNTNPQDPNSRPLDEALLTAYALGQLEAHQRAAVEAEFARNEKARQLVQETAALAGHVYQAQQCTPSLPPSAELREAVEHRLHHVQLEERLMSTQEVPSVSPQPVSRRWTWLTLAVAICLLVAAVPIYLISSGAWPLDQTETAAVQPEDEAISPPTQEAQKDEPSDHQKAQAPLPGAYAASPGGPFGIPSDSHSVPFLTDPSSRIQIRAGGLLSGPTANYKAAAGSNWDQGIYTYDRADTNGGAVPEIDALAMQLPPVSMTTNGALGQWTFDSTGAPHNGPDFTAGIPAAQPKLGTMATYPSTDPARYPAMYLDSNGPQAYDPPITLPEPPGAPTSAMADYSARLPLTPSYRPGDMYGVVAPTVQSGAAPAARVQWDGQPQSGELGVTADSSLPPAPHGNGAIAGVTYSPDGKNLTGGSAYQPADTSGDAAKFVFSKGGESVVQGPGSSTARSSPPLQSGVLSIGGAGPVTLTELSGGQLQLVSPYPTYDAGNNVQYWRLERGEQVLGIPGTEQYEAIPENPFIPAVGEKAVSTFSIDVDTASYANVRRFLSEGRLPPPEAVRIEEMVNYFQYDYPQPAEEVPFSVDMEVAQCPWNGEHKLLRIGLKGREIPREQRGPSNLVFLLDVSGSMQDEDKLPLVKQAMSMLVDELTEDDRVSIVTYADGTEVRLPSTGGHDHTRIRNAIDALSAGGSTYGSAGILLAYEQAAEHFVPGGVNRVILATDGDLNVGITDDDELVKLIKEKAKSGVFLTVLGFGTGNIKDAKLEKLADHGNGLYAYVDNFREARKVLVEQMSGSLVTIAKDVKVQIEFNPAEVQSYRLIGYENRLMAAEDFANDKKDAGEIGAGHTVTALYEIVPDDTRPADGDAAGLKYQQAALPERNLSEAAASGEMATLKLRYKLPDQRTSTPLEFAVKDAEKGFGEASADFRFATAVATFGMVLRGSRHAGPLNLAAVEEFAAGAIGDDPGGFRTEFVDLVRRARSLGR